MKQKRGRLGGLLLAVATMAAPAAAQGDPRFALVASLPTPTVSFQWEITERFALRVDGSYSYREDTEEESIRNEPTTTNIGTTVFTFGPSSVESRSRTTTHSSSIGVAALIALHRTDLLRLYAAPRVFVGLSRYRAISQTTTTVSPEFTSLRSSFPDIAFESSSTSPGAGASFGADVNVLPRLAVFGEAGLTYVRDTPSSSSGAADTRRTTLSTRAAAGVMIRF